jgi:putative DNA-invertase from lambdoid prophage Rac
VVGIVHDRQHHARSVLPESVCGARAANGRNTDRDGVERIRATKRTDRAGDHRRSQAGKALIVRRVAVLVIAAGLDTRRRVPGSAAAVAVGHHRIADDDAVRRIGELGDHLAVHPRAFCSLVLAGEQIYVCVCKRTSGRMILMAVYGYTRVSTSRQAEEGESLDVQQRTIAGYALMLGLTVDRTFIERGVSGSVPLSGRAEGSALLAALKPGDVLITPKLDRMFRSALDALDVLATLKGRNVSLHMIDLGGDVTGNGISKLVFTILSAVAEAERDRIRERITQVKRDQRQRNRYLGGIVPFGFRVGGDGGLVPDAAEQGLIAHARTLRADGATLRAIQAVLEVQHGRKLSLDALHRMLAGQSAT